MKILSSEDIRKADAHTIKHEPIESIDLMERASESFVRTFTLHFGKERNVKVFCGTGNNGGDGLAISRLLIEKGYEVRAFAVRFEEGKGSDDFKINYQRLRKLIHIDPVNGKDDIPELNTKDVVIDAIFGSGLTRPVEGFYSNVIDRINQSSCRVVSVDIASGLFMDHPAEGDSIIEPDLTISFQMPKLAFFIPENEDYVGDFVITDIGLDKKFIGECDTSYHFIEENDVRPILKKRKKFSHKGHFGRVLIISGGKGKMGAAVLSARACLKSGAGLVTMNIPSCGYEIIQTSIPEAMAITDPDEIMITRVPDISPFDTIGIGPGIGTSEQTIAMLGKLLDQIDFPLVLDADALNILGMNKELIKKLPENSILTPHPKEFERLAGKCDNHFDRLARQREFSEKNKVIVVLKGAYTSISSPDGRILFNSTGNPGMATGGSGDVLTGMITGILAQRYPPLEAAMLGIYLHGSAGDLAAGDLEEEGITASDLIDYLPQSIKRIKKIA